MPIGSKGRAYDKMAERGVRYVKIAEKFTGFRARLLSE
jgi:hypothetical protein